MALDATVGGASANSYVDLTFAQAYVDTAVYQGSWSTRTQPQKEAALITATRRLEGLDWYGVKSSQAQSLAWPRQQVTNPDGWPVDPATIPPRVKEACCELALRELDEDRGADAMAGLPQRVKVGPVEVDYGSGSPKRPGLVTAPVMAMIQEFVASSPGIGARLVRL